MIRHVPNLLTASRFFLAIGFFYLLSLYDVTTIVSWPLLDVALALFLVAVLTDIVDGWLARRFGHTTTFGRIADPFVDKILVCGALVYFSSGQFSTGGTSGSLVNETGWKPWMVIVVLAREFLVTGMRSLIESQKMDFSAVGAGKLKLAIQFVAIIWALTYLGHFADGTEAQDWARICRDVLPWLTTLVTALSGAVYIRRACTMLRSGNSQ
jgi:CDP-diacylglycerol---glycerol-3-phosphate 3-phosphatidyltransferase